MCACAARHHAVTFALQLQNTGLRTSLGPSDLFVHNAAGTCADHWLARLVQWLGLNDQSVPCGFTASSTSGINSTVTANSLIKTLRVNDALSSKPAIELARALARGATDTAHIASHECALLVCAAASMGNVFYWSFDIDVCRLGVLPALGSASQSALQPADV